jgi:serine/threonine-protein kinase RsbW
MQEGTVAETTIKLVIPSEVKLVDLVHGAAEKMAELAGFDGDEALNVGLAVREAAINAIVHGNHQDPSLSVDVTFTAGDDALEARIRDEGPGFDPEGTADPTDEENLLRTSGRGLLLIRAFVDDVVFERNEDRGMQVTLTKRRVQSGESTDSDS